MSGELKSEPERRKTVKIVKIGLMALILVVAAQAQTKDHGLGAFSNESGAILTAVDASLVNLDRSNPYIMFVAFFASADQSRSLTIAAKDVVLVHKGQEYRMPSVKELRSEYRGAIRDITFYQRLGKEGIMASWIRFYDFPERANFFPPLTLNAPLPAAEGSMVGQHGFMTPLYFKNPGFAKGDRLLIKVRDAKDPGITGECDVILN
jgi:hypothetical protein